MPHNILTMQGVADLARVQRSVVTKWRSRYASSDDPFPAPLPPASVGRPSPGLAFNATEVAQWLERTGRGNNPEPLAEAALFSDDARDFASDVEQASALALAAALTGEPLAELDPTYIPDLLREAGGNATFEEVEAITEALKDTQAVERADRLAESAYGGASLFALLENTLVSAHGPLAQYSMNGQLSSLLVLLIEELGVRAGRRIVPVGEGGIALALATHRCVEEASAAAWIIEEPAGESSVATLLTRALMAEGCEVSADRESEQVEEPYRGTLVVGSWAAESSSHTFFTGVLDMLLDLGKGDVALVLGPADSMVFPKEKSAHGGSRTGLIFPRGSVAPLRYSTLLPKGMMRFAGRRQLALWLFAEPQQPSRESWTVLADHSAKDVTAAEWAAVAGDVASALEGAPALRSRALARAQVLATERLRSLDVWLPQASVPHINSAETMVELEAIRGVSRIAGAAVQWVAVEDPAPSTVLTWAKACQTLIQEVQGVNLRQKNVMMYPHGDHEVVGPTEVRDPALRGRRFVNRMEVEMAAPRVWFTRPGDVIFSAEGGAAAFVDEVGGRVVEAPARVARIRDSTSRVRVVPYVLARDISCAHGTDRQRWNIRVVPRESAESLARELEMLAGERARLEEERARLDRWEHLVADGVCAGLLQESGYKQTA